MLDGGPGCLECPPPLLKPFFDLGETGSVEIGKKTDMVVLDRNLLTTPVEELDQVTVLLTLLDGKPTYRDASF